MLNAEKRSEKSGVRHQSVRKYRSQPSIGEKRRDPLDHVHRNADELRTEDCRYLRRKASLPPRIRTNEFLVYELH